MCLDINQHSTIDKHLAKKVTDLTKYTGSTFNKIISKEFPEDNHDHHASEHNLTMLPSFHISLGAPNNTDPEDLWFKKPDIMTIIGDIALANIHISKKNNKKSAWIPLHPESFHFLPDEVFKHFPSVSTENQNCHSIYDNWLHISLANLTGNPHDSIARPEDCIIDNITA